MEAPRLVASFGILFLLVHWIDSELVSIRISKVVAPTIGKFCSGMDYSYRFGQGLVLDNSWPLLIQVDSLSGATR